MRRLLPLTLVCALLCGLALSSAPALAKNHHGSSSHSATQTTGQKSSGPTSGKGSGSGSHGGSGKSKSKGSGGGGSSAQGGNRVLNDCQAHGQLTHSYTKAELRQALSQMSATTKQYSNCYTVIQQALLHTVKGDSDSGGSSSSTTTIVIIIVVVLVVLAAIFGGLAVRRRRTGGPGGPSGPGDGGSPTGGPPAV